MWHQKLLFTMSGQRPSGRVGINPGLSPSGFSPNWPDIGTGWVYWVQVRGTPRGSSGRLVQGIGSLAGVGGVMERKACGICHSAT